MTRESSLCHQAELWGGQAGDSAVGLAKAGSHLRQDIIVVDGSFELRAVTPVALRDEGGSGRHEGQTSQAGGREQPAVADLSDAPVQPAINL